MIHVVVHTAEVWAFVRTQNWDLRVINQNIKLEITRKEKDFCKMMQQRLTASDYTFFLLLFDLLPLGLTTIDHLSPSLASSSVTPLRLPGSSIFSVLCPICPLSLLCTCPSQPWPLLKLIYPSDILISDLVHSGHSHSQLKYEHLQLGETIHHYHHTKFHFHFWCSL